MLTILCLFLFIAAAGFAASLMVMGLFRFYEHLSHGDGRLLKIMTMTLLLFLSIIGAAHWASEEPMSAYTFLALPLGICLLEFFFNDNSFIVGLLRDGLLTTVALIFLIYILFISALESEFQPSDCLFNIRNQSGHEIILHEVDLNTKRIFRGKKIIQYDNNSWGQGVIIREPFDKSNSISLLIYDPTLKKVVWEIIDLPKDTRTGCCQYEIIYSLEGFRQKLEPCG